MKQKCLFLLWCFAATLLSTKLSAQDHITTKLIAADTTSEWTLEINLQNPQEANYTAFQFELSLPDNFTLKEGSVTTTTRLPDHKVMLTPLATSTYKCLVYSPTNAPIVGNSGCVMSMTIVANDSLESGYYTGTLSNFLCATQAGLQTRFDYHAFYINNKVPPLTFTLTYWVDGQVYESIDCVVGDPITIPSTPEKEGHTFVEWQGLPQYMPCENINVEAVFVINQYLLSYKLNNRVIYKEYLDFGAVIVPYKVNLSAGKEFSGWSNLPETMPAHDVVAVGTSYPVGINTLPTDDALVDVYTLQGTLVARQVTYAWLKANLTPGVYIVNNTKVVIRAIDQ